MSFPTRAETEAKLADLIDGRCTQSEASDWAMPWVVMDDPPIDDWGVWNALGVLAGADTPTTDRPYLFGEEDFRAWLEELRGANKNEHRCTTLR